MKKLLILFAALSLLLTGCSAGRQETELRQYTATFLSLFDTVTSIVGRDVSEEAFREKANVVRDALEEYHRLFDIYESYEGMNNLRTINDQAGIAPVRVDGRIIALLKDCREFCEVTGGKVNAAMGSVLALWHDARSEGIDNPAEARLPDMQALQSAAMHASFDAIIIDEEASTVFISDPQLRLDVGAIAKGWSVQRVAESAPGGLLISVGGNVCATGPKDADGTPWVVGVRDPDGSADDFLHTIYVPGGSVVTSGDYQRTYMVEGELYHHIIDPETLYPAKHWRTVTIVCADSGIADMLSTALFLLPRAEGQALLDRYGAQAMWMDAENRVLYSPGFEDMIRT